MNFGQDSGRSKTLRRGTVPVVALALFAAGARAQDATPFIDIVSPPSAAAGAQNLAMKITGTGFAANATVNLNGVELKPTAVAGTQIRVTVPAASLANAQTANIRVFNPDKPPLNGKSNVVYFPIAPSRASVSTGRSDIVVGGNPYSTAVGDFNKDGVRDIAVANGNGNIDILLGKGDGTFTKAPTVAVNGPVALAVGDFNGDGDADLAVTGATSKGSVGVRILLGKGDGTFTVGSVISSSGGPIGGVLAADFNDDGKIDLAVVFPRGNGIEIFLGNGDCTFEMGIGGYGAATIGPAAIGDINGDGKLDLVFYDSSFGVTLLLGKGDGTFTTRPGPQLSLDIASLALADFNNDGKLDLVASHAPGSGGPGTVSILLGKGDGTFALKSSPSVGDFPGPMMAGDLNGDGKLDLAVLNQCGSDPSCKSASAVTFLLGKGDGTFTAVAAAPSIGLDGGGLAMADFNRDGRLDIAASNLGAGTVSVLLQTAAAKGPEEVPDSQ